MRWEMAYAYWYWNEQGDPMAEGWSICQEYGANGWEPLGVVSHPNITWESPRGVAFAGTLTNGCWFVATFKRQVS